MDFISLLEISGINKSLINNFLCITLPMVPFFELLEGGWSWLYKQMYELKSIEKYLSLSKEKLSLLKGSTMEVQYLGNIIDALCAFKHALIACRTIQIESLKTYSS